MTTKPTINRTTAGAPCFMFPIKQPNHKLWNKLKEDWQHPLVYELTTAQSDYLAISKTGPFKPELCINLG